MTFLRPILGNAGIVRIPTDKTKTYSLFSTFDETRYYLNSTLHQSPKVRDVIVNTFTDGVNHVNDPAKKLSMRKSTDRGLTYGSKTTVYDPTDSTYQVGDPAIGYDPSGRLHMLVDVHTEIGVNGSLSELRYMYSDDDGATVSSPTVISPPSTSLLSYRMYGKIISVGGVLMAPSYWVTDEADSTQSSRYIIRSTDQGANWTWIAVDLLSTPFINEGELLAVTNNIIIYVCRYEQAKQFWMYKSTDAGLTWSNLGAMSCNLPKTSADPPRLHKFRADNGKWYAVWYFSDRGEDDIYAVYGRLDNGVDGGQGIWNLSTRTLLRSDPSVHLHYGDFCHYNGNMNARGAWSREASAVANEDNELIYFENLTTQYDTVFAILDPVTIYDKLAQLMGVYAWRGLVSNTTNDWGIVNGSGQVTTWKSIVPGPTSQNFTATAGGITLGDGVVFDGTKALSHSTSTYWNPLSYSSAGVTDVNYTLYFKLKIGTTSNPNTSYGFMGNGAASSANKGMGAWYDDTSGIGKSDSFRLVIQRGVAGYTIDFDNNNVLTPNVFHVICVEIDLEQATQNNKAKLYVDNVLQSTTVGVFNATVAINPTFNMQIGAIGNNVLLFIGSYKDLVVQNIIDLPSVRTNFTQALLDAS